jgi:hypothetical protein
MISPGLATLLGDDAKGRQGSGAVRTKRRAGHHVSLDPPSASPASAGFAFPTPDTGRSGATPTMPARAAAPAAQPSKPAPAVAAEAAHAPRAAGAEPSDAGACSPPEPVSSPGPGDESSEISAYEDEIMQASPDWSQPAAAHQVPVAAASDLLHNCQEAAQSSAPAQEVPESSSTAMPYSSSSSSSSSGMDEGEDGAAAPAAAATPARSEEWGQLCAQLPGRGRADAGLDKARGVASESDDSEYNVLVKPARAQKQAAARAEAGEALQQQGAVADAAAEVPAQQTSAAAEAKHENSSVRKVAQARPATHVGRQLIKPAAQATPAKGRPDARKPVPALGPSSSLADKQAAMAAAYGISPRRHGTPRNGTQPAARPAQADAGKPQAQAARKKAVPTTPRNGVHQKVAPQPKQQVAAARAAPLGTSPPLDLTSQPSAPDAFLDSSHTRSTVTAKGAPPFPQQEAKQDARRGACGAGDAAQPAANAAHAIPTPAQPGTNIAARRASRQLDTAAWLESCRNDCNALDRAFAVLPQRRSRGNISVGDLSVSSSVDGFLDAEKLALAAVTRGIAAGTGAPAQMRTEQPAAPQLQMLSPRGRGGAKAVPQSPRASRLQMLSPRGRAGSSAVPPSPRMPSTVRGERSVASRTGGAPSGIPHLGGTAAQPPEAAAGAAAQRAGLYAAQIPASVQPVHKVQAAGVGDAGKAASKVTALRAPAIKPRGAMACQRKKD